MTAAALLCKLGLRVTVVAALFLAPQRAKAFDGPFGPWDNQDIGETGMHGGATCTNDVFTYTGSGPDICCAADAFNYTYKSWSGDCGFVIRLTQLVGADPFARAGIMFRATLNPASAYAFVLFRAGKETAFQTRDMAGQNTWIDGAWTGTPRWLKLVRSGNTFFGYDSVDGTNWNLIGSTNIAMPSTFLIGLAVTSHSYSTPCTAVCDNLQVAAKPGAPTNLTAVRAFDSIHLSWTDNSTNEQGFRIELRQPWDGTDYYYYRQVGPNVTNYVETWLPGAFFRVAATGILDSAYSEIATPQSEILDPLPPIWQRADIGSPSISGSGNYRDETLRVGGSGSDIGGMADQCHFVYQQIDGSGDVAAFFPYSMYAVGGNFADYGMKSGLMFRQSLAANSPDVFVFLTPKGAGWQVRPYAGATTSYSPTSEWRYPGIWLRLARNGPLFTAYIAGQQFDWIQIGSGFIEMHDPILVGLAVCSHNTNFLQLTDFANPRVAPLRGKLTAQSGPNGSINLHLSAMFGRVYGIDASSDLRSWLRLTTKMNIQGTISYSTNDVSLYPYRFYRSVLVQ